MVNWHGPVVARNVPIKLVIVLEMTYGVLYRVRDFYSSRIVDRTRYVDFEISIAAGSLGFVTKAVSIPITHRLYIEKQRVIRSARTGILHRNNAMDAMPFADKHQVDVLDHERAAVLADVDIVFEIGNAPALRIRVQAGSEQHACNTCRRQESAHQYRTNSGHGFRTSRPRVHDQPALFQRTVSAETRTCQQ